MKISLKLAFISAVMVVLDSPLSAKDYHSSIESKKNGLYPELLLKSQQLLLDGFFAEEKTASSILLAKKKRRKRKKRKKGSRGGSVSPVMYILPFGIGQFANGSPVLGSVFALVQLGAGAFGASQYSAAKANFDETDQYIVDRNAEFDTLTSEPEQTAHSDATAEEVDKRRSARDGMVQQANIGFGIALGAYLWSVVEAFMNPKKGRRKKKGGWSGDTMLQEFQAKGRSEDHELHELDTTSPVLPKWEWAIKPTLYKKHFALNPSVKLQVKLSF